MEVRIHALQAIVLVFHDPQVRVIEHVGPFLHAFEDLGLYLLVRVTIISEAEEGVGECAGGEFAVHFGTAVLGEGICKLYLRSVYVVASSCKVSVPPGCIIVRLHCGALVS